MEISKKLLAVVLAVIITSSLFGIMYVLTAKPQETYTISISTVAFGQHQQYGDEIRSGSVIDHYRAPVQLPQGSKITKLAFCARDIISNGHGLDTRLYVLDYGDLSGSTPVKNMLCYLVSTTTPAGKTYTYNSATMDN